MPFSRAFASCLLLGLVSAHTAVASAKGNSSDSAKQASRMEQALLANNKKLRVRENIVEVIDAWAEAKKQARTHEAKVEAQKGEARMWGVLAHWSGRSEDKKRAEQMAKRAERSEARLAKSHRKQRALDVWLTKVVVEVSEEQFKLVFPIDHEVTLQRGELRSKKKKKERRIYFDLHPLVASKKALGKIPIEHAGVRQARVGQLDSRTVRVVFDILEGERAPTIEASTDSNETAILVSNRREAPAVADATQLDDDDPLQALIEKLAQSSAEAGDGAPAAAESQPEQKTATPDKPKKKKKKKIALNERIRLSPSTRKAIEPRKDEWLAGIKRVVIDPGHGGKDTGALGRRGTREKDINLAIALKVGKELEQKLGVKVVYTRKSDVFISLKKRAQIANGANADLFVSIHANAHKSSSVSGIETYYLNTTSSRYSSRLARRENSESFDPKHLSSAAPESQEDESGVLPPGALGRDLRLLLADLAMKSAADESRRLAGYVQSSAVGSLRRAYQSVKDLGVKRALFYVLLGVRMPSILVESGFVTNSAEEKRLTDPRYQAKLATAIANGVKRFVDERREMASRF